MRIKSPTANEDAEIVLYVSQARSKQEVVPMGKREAEWRRHKLSEEKTIAFFESALSRFRRRTEVGVALRA